MTFFNPIGAGSGAFSPKGAGPGDDVMYVATSWSTRPTESPADGEWLYLQDTGSIKRYSEAFGEWVPYMAYSSSMVLDAKLDGDIDPASESPVWTEATSGGGTVTTTGVEAKCTTTVNADAANAKYSHSQTAVNFLAIGTFRIVTHSGALKGAHIAISNGSDEFVVGNDSGNWHHEDATTADEIKVASNADTWLELIWLNGSGTWVFADHDPTPIMVVAETALTASATSDYLVGDSNASGYGDLRVKNAKFGRF